MMQPLCYEDMFKKEKQPKNIVLNCSEKSILQLLRRLFLFHVELVMQKNVHLTIKIRKH